MNEEKCSVQPSDLERLITNIYAEQIFAPQLANDPFITEIDAIITTTVEQLKQRLPQEEKETLAALNGNIFRQYLRVGAYSYLLGLNTEL